MALCLALGMVLSDLLAPPVWGWWAVALGAWGGSMGLFLACRKPVWISLAIWLTVLAGGGLRHHQYTRLLPSDHISRVPVYGQKAIYSGRLQGNPESLEDGRRRVRLSLISRQSVTGQWTSIGGDLLLTIGPEVVSFDADAEDVLRFSARLIQPQPARNPGAFDYRRFLEVNHGIHGIATIYRDKDVIRVDERAAPWWQQRIGALRLDMRRALTAHLPAVHGALLVGMLVGDRHAIPSEVASRFRTTGLAHALVISGLHVGLVAVFLLTTLKILRLPDRLACGITVLLLAAYSLVTGGQAPVVRASVMAAIVLAGRALQRRGAVLNSLGLAALLLMTIEPTSVLTLSFQLSFVATLAIVTLYPALIALVPERWHTGWAGKGLVMPAAVSLAAQIGTAPLILHSFGQVAPISLVANLVVVPLLGVAVAQGLLLVAIAPIVPALTLPVSGGCWFTLEVLMRLVALFARIPAWHVAQPSSTAVLVMLGGLVATTTAVYLPNWRRWVLIILLIVANLAVWRRAARADGVDVVFLDVGQGDAAVLRLPDHRTMIIDAGMRSRRLDMGERVVVPWLRRQGIDVVDIVVATHPHADHIGGLIHLLEEMPVRHYVDAGQQYNTWTTRRLHALLAEGGTKHHVVSAGDSLTGLGGVGGLVLHPTRGFVDEGQSRHGLNNGSVVLRLDYGGRRILFTGDIEHETDPSMLAWGPRLRADVLKVAHHGSGTSSGRDFVAGVDPQLSVISVGARNKFRHPSPRVVDHLAHAGPVLRTDQDGAIRLWLGSGGAMRARTMLSGAPSHTDVDRFHPSQ